MNSVEHGKLKAILRLIKIENEDQARCAPSSSSGSDGLEELFEECGWGELAVPASSESSSSDGGDSEDSWTAVLASGLQATSTDGSSPLVATRLDALQSMFSNIEGVKKFACS